MPDGWEDSLKPTCCWRLVSGWGRPERSRRGGTGVGGEAVAVRDTALKRNRFWRQFGARGAVLRVREFRYIVRMSLGIFASNRDFNRQNVPQLGKYMTFGMISAGGWPFSSTSRVKRLCDWSP
jgi:hypothetical protein